jgi:hypothetical protein
MKLIITIPHRGLSARRLPTLGAALQSALGLRSPPDWQLVADEAQPLPTVDAAAACGITPDGFLRAAVALQIEPAAIVGTARTWHLADVERVKTERRPRGRPAKPRPTSEPTA